MSCPAFAWALERGASLGLLPSDRLVLIFLADMANGEMVCWPGQPTIVKFTGLAIRTVREAIHRLDAAQLIRVVSSPGRAPRYHILRPAAPANGAGNPGNPSQGHPGKMYQGTPANGSGAPRQNVPDHPGNPTPEPRYISTVTPAECINNPLKTLRDPRARASAREAGKVLRFEKKPEASPPPSQPAQPQPPTDVATVDGDPAGDRPPDPGAFQALIANIARGFQNNYPPRAAALSPEEMIEVCAGKPPVKPLYAPDAYLRQQRAELAARAAAAMGRSP